MVLSNYVSGDDAYHTAVARAPEARPGPSTDELFPAMTTVSSTEKKNNERLLDMTEQFVWHAGHSSSAGEDRVASCHFSSHSSVAIKSVRFASFLANIFVPLRDFIIISGDPVKTDAASRESHSAVSLPPIHKNQRHFFLPCDQNGADPIQFWP